MNTEHYEGLITHLEAIRAELAEEHSLPRLFARGVVYGVGFFLGSAIIATILLGILGPWVAQIGWIRDAFITGASLAK